ncbi:importin alpha isoform 2 [Actinidia rufa]|uniref:Importin alpha isoform 2 n=1 Tax=Actinidia rufa TaxID=165716 RepID=A0A7J0EVP8_9ERIC|nr:importin alpha isoform 2 [Actinidia rufa]
MSLRPSARTEVRRNRYKVAVDAEEGRRRREDNMVEIRKSRREESLMKKRREGLQPNQQFPGSLQSASALEKKLEHLPAMVAGVWTEDGNLQLEATTQFRKLLSIERSPPIDEVIQSGVVPRFVEFLVREDFPQLQFIISHQALPCLLNLLTSSYKKSIKKEACWTISNITAGNKEQIQDSNSEGLTFLFPPVDSTSVEDFGDVISWKVRRLIILLVSSAGRVSDVALGVSELALVSLKSQN